MSFYSPGTPGRGARADARREAIENDVAGRRLVKEAEREEALEEGKPLHRSVMTRLHDALRRHDD